MKKILIVNDCRFESIIMKDCLNDIGYNAEITNEYDVFLQIRKFEPDVVIANLIMKDTTGDKLIEYIKSIDSKIVCLLSSCDVIKREEFIDNKVDEVIHTPIDKLKLANILNKVLSKSEEYTTSTTIINKKIVHSNIPVISEIDNNIKSFSFCPYCGKKLISTDKNFLFCPYCGQKMSN